MSDAADPDAEDTFSGEGTELEMIRGDATARTTAPVVFADARCVGCRNVHVCNVPHGTKEWTPGKSFADRCKVCSVITPHNIMRLLSAVNRSHDRGYLDRGDGGGQ